ncbi:MAG: RIP metalloprotease RseP [Gammaproteobacteria bacterium]|nr:RIP metalloprotease RseP [Gammaproteobacteria bacterium]
MGVLTSVLSFIVAIGILVTVHEFGHFIVARRLGVKVLRFSVGFGMPLWIWRRRNDETEYVIAALPLGGYVQMLDEREAPVPEAELPRAFNRKPLGSRFAIVAAGPIFNFLFAILAYWVIFMVGVDGIKPLIGAVNQDSLAAEAGFQPGDRITRIDARDTATWNMVFLELLDRSLDGKHVTVTVVDADQVERRRELDFDRLPAGIDRSNLLQAIGLGMYRPTLEAVIGTLEPGGAAEQAGLRVGDRVVAVDGRSIAQWEEWVDYVRAHPEQELEASIERDGRMIAIKLRPQRVTSEQGDIGRIGAAVRLSPDIDDELRARERYAAPTALLVAAQRTWDMTWLTAKMLVNMVRGEVAASNLGGPIRIAQYAGASADAGMIQFIGFLALISISLGLLNLLPIPVLDGGHLLYYLIEMVKGSPVSDQAQAFGQRIGIAFLLGVMILAFYNDIVQLFG